MTPDDERRALLAAVQAGLDSTPKTLPSRWFYDARGSELFQAITELPEYYLTRTEAGILRRDVGEIVARTRPSTIIELGSGTSAKTRLLLQTARATGQLERFVALDVSEETLRSASQDLAAEFPGLAVHAVVGDFTLHLPQLPAYERPLVVFLGSTIGNLDRAERARFLRQVRSLLGADGGFLLGVDLVKDPAELVRAYDDARGITAAFNRNLLSVLNRELGATFEVESFEHVALYNAPAHRIEMLLRSLDDQAVELPAAGRWVAFARGEMVRTEISTKFTRAEVQSELRAAGLELAGYFSDERDRFALALGVPASVGKA